MESLGEPNHGPQPEYPSSLTVLSRLQQHVNDTPQAVALVLPEGEFTQGERLELSYEDMWSLIEDTATELRRAGVRSGWITVVLPSGLSQVIAVWAILRAGCGYVPIDSQTEAPRLRTLLEQTQPAAAVGSPGVTALSIVAAEFGVTCCSFPNGVAAGLMANCPVGPLDAPLPVVKVQDTALLLFSSGSTGVPKGIVYDHKCNTQPLDRSSNCLLRCSYVWSVSLYDLFPANLMGGTLFVPPDGGHKNVQYMADTIERENIHAVVIQPTLLNLLLDEHNNSSRYPLRSLRHVVSSGEKLFSSTAQSFLRAPGLNAQLWNMYGATEAGCTYMMLRPSDRKLLDKFPESVPAGIPQAYVDVFVMAVCPDASSDPLTPVPTGTAGEICFGGGGNGFLACGYWRNEQLTAEKFVCTRSYGRLYRTGDAGRWHDGRLLIAGRIDRQLKVRGVRIQPESIEARLKRYPGPDGTVPIKACMVVPSSQQPIELTAFVETAAGLMLDTAAVMEFLKQELGKVYLPKHLVHLQDGLPRTSSGKPDIGQLRQLASHQEDVAHVAVEDEPETIQNVDASSVLGQPTPELDAFVWLVDLRMPLWKFVQDHKYKGEALFPGSGYITLAAEVVAWFQQEWELLNIEFKKPLQMSSPRPLHVSAKLQDSGASIAISTYTTNGEQILHATCDAMPPACNQEFAPWTCDAKGRQEYPIDQLYAELADGGFDYGAQFQALCSASLCVDSASSGRISCSRAESLFCLDPIELDCCFQLCPLVSIVGFQGAPVSMRRVWWQPDWRAAGAREPLQVLIQQGSDGVDFQISHQGRIVCVMLGLELVVFDTITPEILQVVHVPYEATPDASLVPRIIAIGSTAMGDAEQLAQQVGANEITQWDPDAKPLLPVVLSPVAIVVRCDTPVDSSLEGLLWTLGFNLPIAARVWLVVVGSDSQHFEWQCAAKAWAALMPALLLSVIETDEVGPHCRAVLDPEAPPHLDSRGRRFRLEAPAPTSSTLQATLESSSTVGVLTPSVNPLSIALVQAIAERGAAVSLIVPGESCDAKDLVLVCAVTSEPVDAFEAICAAATSCVTLCSMHGLLPSSHSQFAASQQQAASASELRSELGHSSWIVHTPPLMDGRWFEPAAPAGSHRCSVQACVRALLETPIQVSSIIGSGDASAELPKQWAAAITTDSAPRSRSIPQIREFLLREVASTLKIKQSAIDQACGLEDLGVGSLDTLRLSQKLRKFLGFTVSAFAMQNNPTIEQLLKTLVNNAHTVTVSTRPKVLCLHGFRTSGAVLQQQMLPLTTILDSMGFDLIVPDAPHRAAGPAQGAQGLDEDDSYGWWLYGSESHYSNPIGLDASITLLEEISADGVVGVVGFSQGGAMAAQVAQMVRARWALLFSPVFVPGKAAQCNCPTMLAYDPADEVHEATKLLIGEMEPKQLKLLKHEHGHRIPPKSDWYNAIEDFLKEQS